MKVWKQLALCAVVLILAAGAWAYSTAAGRELLAGLGVEWAGTAKKDGEGSGQASSGARRSASVVTSPAASATITGSAAMVPPPFPAL